MSDRRRILGRAIYRKAWVGHRNLRWKNSEVSPGPTTDAAVGSYIASWIAVVRSFYIANEDTLAPQQDKKASDFAFVKTLQDHMNLVASKRPIHEWTYSNTNNAIRLLWNAANTHRLSAELLEYFRVIFFHYAKLLTIEQGVEVFDDPSFLRGRTERDTHEFEFEESIPCSNGRNLRVSKNHLLENELLFFHLAHSLNQYIWLERVTEPMIEFYPGTPGEFRVYAEHMHAELLGMVQKIRQSIGGDRLTELFRRDSMLPELYPGERERFARSNVGQIVRADGFIRVYRATDYEWLNPFIYKSLDDVLAEWKLAREKTVDDGTVWAHPNRVERLIWHLFELAFGMWASMANYIELPIGNTYIKTTELLVNADCMEAGDVAKKLPEILQRDIPSLLRYNRMYYVFPGNGNMGCRTPYPGAAFAFWLVFMVEDEKFSTENERFRHFFFTMFRETLLWRQTAERHANDP